ncbi:MAG: pyruvate:ferredoxin (flavodoxin) oxidoreductase [Cyanobacteria bacterium]|nr:pyruvate:ferredoxin (flavodoxin) oxidoreductase [Cyanobacteriota bacterium]
MTGATLVTMDGNEAVARVAYRLNEVIALYPITPATPMGEWADAWGAQGRPNLWGTVPAVVQLQSEGGAAGAVHGALQVGSLTTTFTASQGLLLMIPNLYKWAGELTPVVLHVASRALAAQGLSIFGDHGDVMAVRGTGCAVLCSASVQEAGDFAAIATRASFNGRLPTVHMFDGFRTSHEIQKVAAIPDAVLRQLLPLERISEHRQRALSPERPVLRGTSQNPDTYFQGRETVNPFIEAFPAVVQEAMATFAQLTGRAYQPYEYVGPADAERLLVLMGSGCETAEETLALLEGTGERLGLLKVRLFRPFAAALFVAALPASARAIAVLDRCKEPGAVGEPLYLEVVAALAEAWPQRYPDRPLPQVLGGRYGLASKEFTPAMVKAVCDHLLGCLEPVGCLDPASPRPLNHFSVGIDDDVSHRSLPLDSSFLTEGIPGADPGQVRAIVYGLGSDGTVGGNKSTIKIIGEGTDLFVQAYFVYDSKKSGSMTVSHLRFGPRPIRSAYLVQRPMLVACHQWDFVDRLELTAGLVEGGTLLLNSPFDGTESWRRLPAPLRAAIRDKRLDVWVINAYRVAREAGMGPHINTVMQVCFFAVSGVLPRPEAIERIRASIRHTYGAKGEAVVAMNLRAVEATLEHLVRLDWRQLEEPEPQPGTLVADPLATAPAFVREVIGPLLQRKGDELPVSAIPCDGTWPTGTARWEKRNIAESVPLWESDLCVQCGKCVLVCPHAVIRAKVVAPEALAAAPEGFRQAPARDPDFAGQAFTLQVSAADCTGCSLCVEVCPARDRSEPRRKAINMVPQRPLREQSRRDWAYFEALPEVPRAALNLHKIGQQQLQQPLFEFSGACGGCGETPYLKLISQLFGDRLLVANATGCSSIYGGNLPTTPWSRNAEGRGPAWSNSLFEDNAEFGFGMRVGLDQQRQMALELLVLLAQPGPDGVAATLSQAPLPQALVEAIASADQSDEAGIVDQRQRVGELKRLLRQALAVAECSAEPSTVAGSNTAAESNTVAWSRGVGIQVAEPAAAALLRLLELADALVKTSVWLVGGDGWAYDIGFGGLDHVLASGRDVNALVLDTEVYSNTGGQMSKATPRGAVAKFATAGKAAPKKDLGLMAMTCGNVYVASVAMGARDEHTVRAFLEAESYPGPSLILAYSHCIAHGIDMSQGMAQQKLAVDSGRWLLYRHDPRRLEQGLNPLQLDVKAAKRPLAEAMASENRFRMLGYSQPERARQLAAQAQLELDRRWATYRALAAQPGLPASGLPASGVPGPGEISPGASLS